MWVYVFQMCGSTKGKLLCKGRELGAEGDSKAGRVCDLPNKKSGSLDSQGQDQVQGRWSGSASVQWQPCKSIVIRVVQGQARKPSQLVRIRVRTEGVLGPDTQICNVAEERPS